MINHETDVHGFEHGSRTCMAFLWFGMNHWPAFMQIMVSLGLNIVEHSQESKDKVFSPYWRFPKMRVLRKSSIFIMSQDALTIQRAWGTVTQKTSEYPSDSGSPSWLSCCWSSITKVKGKLAYPGQVGQNSYHLWRFLLVKSLLDVRSFGKYPFPMIYYNE